MKERISVTLDKEIIKALNLLMEDRRYRNRSHAVEMAIENLAKNQEKSGKK
ncbi:MAG TPA: ribbon-helix-helix domain-containing protein [Candidatus Nanoarchaeia archaeon]|nr:ribbon-helix-helix domain-containing protein [Candidatus Nanoarchaeia archaeon]